MLAHIPGQRGVGLTAAVKVSLVTSCSTGCTSHMLGGVTASQRLFRHLRVTAAAAAARIVTAANLLVHKFWFVFSVGCQVVERFVLKDSMLSACTVRVGCVLW